ncbi:UNVERIFIED_CONTAM: hypothetical protein K2H54_019775 [Gekko kuhli]
MHSKRSYSNVSSRACLDWGFRQSSRFAFLCTCQAMMEGEVGWGNVQHKGITTHIVSWEEDRKLPGEVDSSICPEMFNSILKKMSFYIYLMLPNPELIYVRV